MVITVYISGISGNKEVKKRQQRVQMILESRNIEFEAIDIAEPGRQAERDRLKTCGATQPVLPPQIFNGDTYCGDYDQFDMANEIDELEKFLKLPVPNNNGISTANLNNDTTSSVERISTTETDAIDAEQTATTTDQQDAAKVEETAAADGAGDGVTSTTNNVDHDANETADADGEPANAEE